MPGNKNIFRLSRHLYAIKLSKSCKHMKQSLEQLISVANVKNRLMERIWVLGLLVLCNGTLLAGITVTTDREQLLRVTEVHPHASMLAHAPAAILVCGDTEKQLAPEYWVQDCSAATQNILLAAHGIGLGAVWLGVHPRAERIAAVREIFALPDHVQPLGIVSIGHPAEDKPRDSRYDDARVHRDRWQEKA